MFSSHIVWAIHILTELNKYSADKNMRRGLVVTTDNYMQKSVMHSVLKKLASKGYIERMSQYNSYKLLVDISKVSVFALVQLFHGDVCIGEIYDHSYTVGKEDFATNEQLGFWNYEQQLKESIRKQLQGMYLSDLENYKNEI